MENHTHQEKDISISQKNFYILIAIISLAILLQPVFTLLTMIYLAN